MKILTIILSLLFFASPAWAQSAPEDFGAVVNDGLDDSSAINAAIAAGGTVVFSDGQYDLGSAVTLASGVSLRGINTVLKLMGGVNSNAVLIPAGVGDVVIKHISVDGNRSNQNASSVCIFADGGNVDIRLRDIKVVECANQGIFLNGTSSSRNNRVDISQSIVSGVGSHGILMHHTSNVVVSHNIVEGWASSVPNRPAITVGRPGSHALVSNNLIRDAAGDNAGGISMDNISAGTAADNIIENVTSWGIEVVDLSVDVTVSGNVIRSASTQGIAVSGNVNGSPQRVAITGNTITSTGQNGIRLAQGASWYGPVQFSITGNSIYNTSANGMLIQDSRAVVITGNLTRIFGASGINVQNSTNVLNANNIQ